MACLLALADDVTAFNSLRQFRAFSLTHALVLIAFALIAGIILALGIRWRDTSQQRRLERTLGIAGLIIWLLANSYGFLPGVFGWNISLPIHVCDLAALTGPIVLLQASPRRWLRCVLYFMGIGLCTQAFITPTLHEGPADPQFWCFWSGHFVILTCALYDVLVRRWRPMLRDLGIAVALSLGYLAVILPLDIAFGWNYGFVGRETKPGTMIEVLGPWPRRVLIIVGLVLIAYTGMMLPWMLLERGIRRRELTARAG